MHRGLLVRWRGFQPNTDYFAFFVTCLAEKIGLPCTNNPRSPNKSAEQMGKMTETQRISKTNRRMSETQHIGEVGRIRPPIWGGGGGLDVG